jgi:c-di-GMP-binding flagellar brake protein YcgR
VEERPNVYDPVVLRDQTGGQYASRVEKLAEGLVVVTQPPALSDAGAFRSGVDLDVTWVDSDNAVIVLPARILAIHADPDMLLWSLVVTGPAVMEQRREVERVEATGPVVLRTPEGNGAAPVPGTLVDISEKAVRCSVETGSADGFFSGSGEVIAEFSVGPADFVVPGRVEFARGTKNPTKFEELVVLFDQPVTEADALRKQIFAQEVQTPAAPGEGGHS